MGKEKKALRTQLPMRPLPGTNVVGRSRWSVSTSSRGVLEGEKSLVDTSIAWGQSLYITYRSVAQTPLDPVQVCDVNACPIREFLLSQPRPADSINEGAETLDKLVTFNSYWPAKTYI